MNFQSSHPFFRQFAFVCLLAISLACLARPTHAVGDPALEWWTLKTAHFRIHYSRELEPIAKHLARMIEHIHDRLTVLLGYEPDAYTEIVLTDTTDSANGSATPLPYNTIRLFVTAPDDLSPLGDYDNWYYELFTHEYTHIAHTDNISGVPRFLNRIFGKSYAPNQIQPRWILEGLAVVEESQQSTAGRLRSSIFDMYLRTDVINNNIASLDQISNTASRWPQGNLWYLYGSRFLEWITDVYGPNTMRAVAADYGASLLPWGINRAIRRVTGKTYIELYEGFVATIRREYEDQMQRVAAQGLQEGTRITFSGRQVDYPIFVPQHLWKTKNPEILYFRDDFNNRAGIYKLNLTPQGNVAQEELMARTNATSSVTILPTGEIVFNSISYAKNVYAYNDLFLLPSQQTSPRGDESFRKKLTSARRTLGPTVSPDGRTLVFTQNHAGTTDLMIAELTPNDTLTNIRTLIQSEPFGQIYTPQFSPDGRTVVYSAWHAGGFRDIQTIDVTSKNITSITHDRNMDTNPVWSPNGQTIYFSSDRNQIHNIYAYNVATQKLKQVTNVRTGAFQPAISADEKTLVYVGYTIDGFDLFRFKLDPGKYLPAPPPSQDRHTAPAIADTPQYTRTRYNPLETLAPRTYSFEYKPGRYEGNALTVSAIGSDVVGHHVIQASIVADANAPEPEAILDYSYNRLPFDFGMRIFRTVAPRSGYRINDEVPIHDELTTGITSGISFPLLRDFESHRFGFSFSAAVFDSDLPVGANLDPYATTTVDPAQGAINIAHIGYSFSNAEGSYDASGPTRGTSINFSVDYADLATGSDFTLQSFQSAVTTYFKMPWPGYQTLASRTSGAIAKGTYTRGGNYAVGGYDLETYPLLDTITTGVFNGAFVLRGYPPNAYVGNEYILQTLEYRSPIWRPDRGISTVPVFFRRIDTALFVDYGGAFDNLDLHEVTFFEDGTLINSTNLHTSIGAELWLGFTLGYFLDTQLRLGYAYGFSNAAIAGGQTYFVAAGGF